METRQDLLKRMIGAMQEMHRGMNHRHGKPEDTLPFAQKAALFTITEHRRLNIKQLAEILHVTSGATTQLVEALVTADLVNRQPDPEDRRNVILSVSPNGKQCMLKLKRKKLAMLESAFQDISDQELAAFVNVITKVSENLRNKRK
jgi:DNA-binding MarR family transcriptional regulator